MKDTEIRKDFLSMAEVGARLGVSRETVRRFVIHQRRIPYVRHGRNYRVPVLAWEQWLAEQNAVALACMKEATHGD